MRRVLAGHRTGSLYVIKWRSSRQALVNALQSMSYGYDELQVFGRLQRMALYTRVTGEDNFEKDIDSRFSNGVTAVLFAIYNGAQQVILAGIDPNSTGHVHDSTTKVRWHAETDKAVIDALMRRGMSIYTSDPGVAARSGIPLWTSARA